MRKIFLRADDAEEVIHISCITLLEILLLAEKKKIDIAFEAIRDALSVSQNYILEPVSLPVISQAKNLPRETFKDPWGRLIAATSLHLGLPLISRDRVMARAGLDVVW